MHLRNDGTIGFVNTPIGNCHSSRYPAFFHNNTAFMQSGVTMIDFETWDSFDFDACGGSPDGKHWFAIGDTENPDTTLDHIFAVDGVKIVQENTEIGATGVIAGGGVGNPVFFCRMLSNGDWYARGDDTVDNDWALRNNVLIAKTGDPITAGSGENWGAVFTSFNGNHNGDWVLTGNTSNVDTTADNVVVRNGEDVLVREGDPVDLNGNGQFDDDVFINTFGPNDVFLTADDMLYFRVTLRNGAATNLGDAFLRLDVGQETPCPADVVVDGTVNITDLLAVISAWGSPGGPADVNGDNTVNITDLLLVIAAWGPCL
ncbi:MAG: dockerin type I domain-containing protein [Phycisphaerales bacterium]|nr:dockerin type I domain-containing protein [Phycisphaerales bacterium]